MTKKRKPPRLLKAYDQYEFKGGDAGFIKFKLNGQDKKLVDRSLVFNRRKVRGVI